MRVARWLVIGVMMCCGVGRAAAAGSSPAETMGKTALPEDFELQLLASEPEVISPIAVAAGPQDRLYASFAFSFLFNRRVTPMLTGGCPVFVLEPENGQYVSRGIALKDQDLCAGITIQDGKLYAATPASIVAARLRPDGTGEAPQTLIRDRAENPDISGFFRLKFGPDGWLYAVSGVHPTDLLGTDGRKAAVRRPSGAIFRFRPDGTGLQLVCQGLSDPLDFDFDAYGHLWAASNETSGRGRLIMVIPGVDYQSATHPAEREWVTSDSPWRPPAPVTNIGSRLQPIVLADDTWPESYWGSLMVLAWGSTPDKMSASIDVFHPDARGNVTGPEPFLQCYDAAVQPSQISVAPNGGMFVVDMGNQPEDEVRGRIYRVQYAGKNARHRAAPLPSDMPAELSPADAKALAEAQGGRQIARQQAIRALAAGKSESVVSYIRQQLKADREPFISSQSLWVLNGMATASAADAVTEALHSKSASVRAQAVRIIREMGGTDAANRLKAVADDTDAEVRIEAALARSEPAKVIEQLDAALFSAAVQAHKDRRLCYQAAVELSRRMSAEQFARLVESPDDARALVGWIAIDVGLLETNAQAVSAMNQLLLNPPAKRIDDLLKLSAACVGPPILPGLQTMRGLPQLTDDQRARLEKIIQDYNHPPKPTIHRPGGQKP